MTVRVDFWVEHTDSRFAKELDAVPGIGEHVESDGETFEVVEGDGSEVTLDSAPDNPYDAIVYVRPI